MPTLPLPEPTSEDIYSFGFDKNIYRDLMQTVEDFINGRSIFPKTISHQNIINETIINTVIAENTIEADRMNVTELSAITANLGTITAGDISGVTLNISNGSRLANWYINTNTISSGAVENDSNVLIDSANSLLRLGPTSSNYITQDGANLRIQSSNYVSGSLGSGFTLDPDLFEVGNIRARGKITTSVFEKDSISSIGGSILISKDSDVLDAEMTALDTSTLQIPGDMTLKIGDLLRIKTGSEDEWMEVTDINSAPTYTVTRDKNGSYAADANPTWQKGTAVVNYGQSGDGGILLTASSENSPRIEVFTHAGSPWSALATRLKIGNLNGYLGLNDNVYGIGIGDISDFLRVYHDGSNLQFKLSLTSANSAAEIDVGTNGYLKSGQTAFFTGTGFWFGNEGGEDKASIGDATQFLKYADSVLQFTGTIEAVTPIQLKTYAFASLPDPIVDTGANSPTASSD